MAAVAISSRRSTAAYKARLARVSSCYLPFKPPGYWQAACCVYCGNKSQSRDHIPPVTWAYALGSEWFHRRGITLVWVPACLECNSTLGDEKLFTILERTQFLLSRYERKYSAIATIPKWDSDELAQLRGRLRIYVESSELHRTGVNRRLAILSDNCEVRSLSGAVHEKP